MSVEGLPRDQSGFVEMDAFDATDPDEFPPLPDRDEDAVPDVDERRLESLLERVFQGDAEPDDALLPAGGEAPFDEADGAEGAAGWPGQQGDPAGAAGPFGDVGSARPETPVEDRAESYEWPERKPDVAHDDSLDDGESAAGEHEDVDFDGD